MPVIFCFFCFPLPTNFPNVAIKSWILGIHWYTLNKHGPSVYKEFLLWLPVTLSLLREGPV